MIVYDECGACQGYGEVEVGPPRDPSRFARMGRCDACGGVGQVESDRMPTRAECYEEYLQLANAYDTLYPYAWTGPDPERRVKDNEVQAAYSAYRAWVEADSFAAQAGCFD